MSVKNTRNVAASVLAKLRNESKASGVTFQQVLQQYAIERLLFRLSKSPHAQSVILKGALLLKTIGIPSARPTMDIDMLRVGKADEATLTALVKDCANVTAAPDGIAFLADSVAAEEITKDAEYKGMRILMDARMDNVRLKIQIDFGVGDVIVPGPRMIEYPSILDSDKIELLAYPIESSIAEKLQAIVALGNANSRMKDFYDVWICSRHLEFNADSLLQAIEATFKNRDTAVPTGQIEAFTTNFAEGHRGQWNTFVKKIGEDRLADSLGDIVLDLTEFAAPLFIALACDEKLKGTWTADAGWVDRAS